MLKNRGFVWQICDFFLPLQRQTKKEQKLWTITRRTITICNGGG
jgi:hypothetical protein